jgi:Single-stranded DNA-specific exonuclease
LITEAIDLLENAKKVRIISHHDSDGIASAAIAKFTLERIGIPHEIIIKNQLLPEDLVGSEGLVYWFNDLGSSKMDSMRNIRGIITDHHTPAVKDVKKKENGNEIYQFNPHLEGIDGGISQSGATTTFLFSLNVIGDVLGVSYLSVVGVFRGSS